MLLTISLTSDMADPTTPFPILLSPFLLLSGLVGAPAVSLRFPEDDEPGKETHFYFPLFFRLFQLKNVFSCEAGLINTQSFILSCDFDQTFRFIRFLIDWFHFVVLKKSGGRLCHSIPGKALLIPTPATFRRRSTEFQKGPR